jgi:hypothetical protein
MKITELNKPKQIDEMSSLAGALFGEVPMAALKGLFTGKGGKHQLAQDIFLRDFYQDALTSLDNGIKSGYVDTNKEYTPQKLDPETKQPDAGQSNPTSAVPTNSPTQVPPAQQTGQQMSPQQTATAKMQTRAGIQPTGQKMSAAQRTQAKLQAQKMRAAQKPRPVKESGYYKLNNIFENIVSEMDGEGESTTSITDHMIEWFGLYMNGVNWENKKAAIIPRIKQIQDTYSSDKGKAAIKNLGRLAYAISGKSGQLPKGAENAAQNVTGATAATKTKSPEQLAADLAAQPPQVQDKIIKQVKDARYK